MAKKVGPNVKCRIIGSSRGPNGSSIGKIVRVVDRADPPEHVVWGSVWDVEAIDGTQFDVKITSPDMQDSHIRQSLNATCAEDWLEPLDDDQLKKFEEEQKQRVLTD